MGFAGFADAQLHGQELPFVGGDRPFGFYRFDQEPGGHSAHLDSGLPDHCQGRTKKIGVLHVAETCQRNSSRNI
jgi:hypothetical protein